MSPIVVTGPTTSTGFAVVIDPDDTPLDISDGSSYRLRDQIGLPDWPLKSVYAGSFDTWGALPASRHMYDNGELTIPLRVYGTSAANLHTQIGLVGKKVAKLNRAENHGIGGEVEITFPSGNSYRFDVVEAHLAHVLDQGFVTRFREDVELRLVCLPGARGDEVELATSSGNGQMIFLADALKGELEGLGRLVVSATSENQAAVHVGVQSRHYDAASTAALSFNGTDLTPLGTSTDTGSAIRNTDLIPSWQAICSTELAGVGHVTHVGDFQVWVRTRRPTGNTGAVSLRFRYAQGTMFSNPSEAGPQVDFDVNEREGVDCWVSVGQVHLPAPVLGTNKWQGRWEALSTVVGDELDIKAVRLWPVTEGYIELSAPVTLETPTSVTVRDEFNQTAGNLTGKTLPVGGTWTATDLSGGTDWQVDATNARLERATTGDAVARGVSAGTTAYAGKVVRADVSISSFVVGSPVNTGIFHRYTDTNNGVSCYLTGGSALGVWLVQCVAVASGSSVFSDFAAIAYTPGSLLSLALGIDIQGRLFVWAAPQGAGLGSPLLMTQDSSLATGGTLDDGKVGVFDFNSSATAYTRRLDNFTVADFATDAAINSGKELELRHNTAVREETTTDEWSTVPVRDGNYLRLAAAGMEGRQNRVAVAAYRNDPLALPNDNDDALTATLYGTPVYLSVPEP